MPEGGDGISLKALLDKKVGELQERLKVLEVRKEAVKREYLGVCGQSFGETEQATATAQKSALRQQIISMEAECSTVEFLLDVIKKAQPFVFMLENLRVDAYPVVDVMVNELRGDLVHIGSTVFLDMVIGTVIEIGKEAEKKEYANEATGLWARGVRRRYDALCAAGFSKDEVMQMVLATMNGGSDVVGSFSKWLIGNVGRGFSRDR